MYIMRGSQMRRTQIYLDETLYDYLRHESEARKKTISDIIRENIRNSMPGNADRIIQSASKVYGVWKDKEIDVDAYVRGTRRDRKI
jgi:hypothetical protein